MSVGQAYHEGEKLNAVIDWVNSHAYAPFAGCVILVADTLQRHNAALRGMDPARAWAHTQRAGTTWIERNLAAVSTLRLPWHITRWNDALHSTRYSALRARIEHLAAHPEVDAALEADERKLRDRWRTRTETIDARRFAALHRAYLLEEITATAVLDAETPAITCYPRALPNTWAHLRTARQAPQALSRLEWLYLRISRRC